MDKISKESLSGFDFAQYQQALRFLGYISHLFSSSSTPLIVTFKSFLNVSRTFVPSTLNLKFTELKKDKK